jgi:hypothetical protein
MENPQLKQEMIKALSLLINAFVRSAVARGLSTIILSLACTGLIIWIDQQNKAIREMRLEHKLELSEIRNEYRKEIASMRSIIDAIAEKADDCQKALIKSEGEKAALLAVIKMKR